MRSELLYTAEHGYDDELHLASLYEGAFAQGYGRGSGTVDWDGRAGTIEWANFPPMRPDGVFLPSLNGVIRLEGTDRPILFALSGISLPPDPQGHRLIGAAVRWYTDDPEYAHLNDVIGYEEGEIDVASLRITTRTFALHPEADTAPS